MEQLYIWRNDPDVRRWSFHKDIVSLDEHEQWFRNSLERNDVMIFILEDEGLPVGQVRLTYWYDELVIGYSIDRNFRGRHLGQCALDMLEGEILQNSKIRKDGVYLIAYVEKENIASRKIFRTLNYWEEEQSKWIKYIKKIGSVTGMEMY